ncbi:efflux RND transporter periplasmic adaptor subunit [Thalassococcus sp. S3]|uniref:efflux RND transporter periplasmic adaptor subunit n=1 Tax=Thalassococcus sp. S3 TaxID=2017482 RepID=UPI0013EEB406|nr:efflux RND transporter periplasmic adaptor subunit [Thalassococcus sp. S3]
MTDNADLEEKLRSLAIERKEEPAGKPRRRRWPAVAALLLMTAAGSAVAFPGLRGSVADTVTNQVGQFAGMWSEADPVVKASAKPGEVRTADRAPTPTPRPAIQTARSVPNIVGSGHVIAPKEVVVQSEIPGRVDRLGVDIGDIVRKGDVVAWLDATEAELALEIAQSDVELARSEVNLARAELAAAEGPIARLETLVDRGTASSAQLSDARLSAQHLAQAIAVAQRKLDTAQLRVAQARATLDRHVLRAPFDAVVVERPAAPGMLLSSGEDGGADAAGLMTLMDVSEMFIDVDVAERNIAGIRADMPAEAQLDAYPDRKLDARVVSINPRASREKGTVTVRLKLETADLTGVLANMAAKVTFTADRQLELSAVDIYRRQ